MNYKVEILGKENISQYEGIRDYKNLKKSHVNRYYRKRKFNELYKGVFKNDKKSCLIDLKPLDRKREVEKEADLRIKASYFNYGEFKAEEQEKMLKEVNGKVEEVYVNCIGSNEANISTLQMLTNIENNGAPWQFSQSDRLNWAKEE